MSYQNRDGGANVEEFWPDFISEQGGSDVYVYAPFKTLVERANAWLAQQTGIELINCETSTLKYRGRKRLDLNRTMFRSYVGCGRDYYIRGLRVWYRYSSSSSSTPPKLGVYSFAPTVVGTDGDWPKYKKTSEEYQRINSELASYCTGKILNVETVEIKQTVKPGFDGKIDTEKTGYKELYYHKSIIQFLRVYVIQTDDAITEQIGFKDFIPVRGSGMFAISSYESLEGCMEEANEWMSSSQFPGTRAIGMQVLENHFHGGELGDSDYPLFLRVERLTHTTVKTMRLHFIMGGEKTKPKRLTMKPLAPQPVSGQGCCATNAQPLVEHTQYIGNWVRLSGATVMSVQTTFVATNEMAYGDTYMRSTSMGEWDFGGDRRGPLPMNLLYMQRIFVLGDFREPSELELPHLEFRTGCCPCCTLL